MSLFGLADTVLRPRTAWGHAPEAIAVALDDEQITYRQLSERILRLAAGLSGQGFGKGDVAAVLLKNRIEYFEIVYAVAHLGGVLVPLNYLLRPAEVAHIVADSAAGWLFTEADLLASVPAGHPHVYVAGQEGAYTELAASDPGLAPPARVLAEDRLLLQYTSGTTGFPKGAVHTHGTVLFNALAQIVDFSVTAADVHLVVPSLSWSAGLHCLTLSTLWRGGTVVLKRTGGFDPDDLGATIERYAVTTAMLAPSVLRMVLDAHALDRHDFTSLRLVLSGGEPVTPAEIGQVQARLPGLALNQGYGISEFPTTMVHLAADDVVAHQGAAGLSSLTANVRVLDESGGDCPTGQHGEIAVRSPQSSTLYHDRTSAVRDGWLRTGDRGFLDEGGFLHVAGRVREMIVSGGLNIYPAEVERVLMTLEGVLEAAVIGVPDRRYGEVGHAFVVCAPESGLNEAALREHARQALAGFKVPRRWTLRSAPLPRTVTGKLRRFELR